MFSKLRWKDICSHKIPAYLILINTLNMNIDFIGCVLHDILLFCWEPTFYCMIKMNIWYVVYKTKHLLLPLEMFLCETILSLCSDNSSDPTKSVRSPGCPCDKCLCEWEKKKKIKKNFPRKTKMEQRFECSLLT